MQEQLISFETAKLAKEKGFNIPTNSYRQKSSVIGDDTILPLRTMKKPFDWNNYSDDTVQYYSISTQSLLQKWLREKHNKFVKTHPIFKNGKVIYEFIIFLLDQPLEGTDGFKNMMSLLVEPYWWNTDEEALEKGLQEALKLI